MKRLISLAGVISLACSMSAHAECAYPKAPDALPDGKTASEPEMMAAMSAFKQYNTDVDSYLACLDQETAEKSKDAAGASAILQIKAMQSKKRASATDERQAKIDEFNKQVRTFKTKG